MTPPRPEKRAFIRAFKALAPSVRKRARALNMSNSQAFEWGRGNVPYAFDLLMTHPSLLTALLADALAHQHDARARATGAADDTAAAAES